MLKTYILFKIRMWDFVTIDGPIQIVFSSLVSSSNGTSCEIIHSSSL